MKQPPNRAEIKRILAAIVQIAGGRLEGKTILFKAYYHAHLFYWRDHEGTLTRDPELVHMPNGPGLHDHRAILREMEQDGLLVLEAQQAGPYSEHVYVSKRPVQINEQETDAIRKALEKLRGMTAAQASEQSHGPSWHATDSGEHMPIYLDALGPDELAEMRQRAERSRSAVRNVFG